LAVVVFATTPFSAAADIFVYDLASDGSQNGGSNRALSGSITVNDSVGAAFPLLDGSSVENFTFTADTHQHWSKTNSVFADDVGFNGTLGAATLSPSSGNWGISNPLFGNLGLYSAPVAPFGAMWDWTLNGLTYDFGFTWELKLVSVTTTVPEPSTLTLLGLALASMAGRGWRNRKKSSAAV
jgi:hypothetical protein